MWAINTKNISRLLVSLSALALLVSACGPTVTPVPTPLPPTLTLTPRSTILPTPVVTAVSPLGSADRPFQIVLVPPKDSIATGTSLATFLSDTTSKTFNIALQKTDGDILNALCGDKPTIAWVDGWTLLSTLAQNCGFVTARIRNGGQTGIRADIVISPSAAISGVTAFKNRVFCRINALDETSWILPVIAMRAGGFNPSELKSVQDYPDTKSMLQIVANNGCVSAIPSGTLSGIRLDPPFSDATRVVTKLITTPELPYGGLVMSSNVPGDIAAQVTDAFLKNPDQLKDLVTADEIIAANSNDFSDTITAFGSNLKALGQQ